MTVPSRPAEMYLFPEIASNPSYDSKLLENALEYRISKQLMTAGDFYRNITVWKLVHKDKSVQYLTCANDSDEEGFKKAVQIRRSRGMTAKEAKEDAAAQPANSGIHSEQKLIAEIRDRPDIRDGTTKIEQVFTERKPCISCQAFMRQWFPAVSSTPFYYFLLAPGVERRLQLQRFGGDVMLYLQYRYGA